MAIGGSIYPLRKEWFFMSVRKVGALGFGMTNFKEVLEEIDKAIAERYVFSN